MTRALTCEKDVKAEVKRLFKQYGVWWNMPVQTGYSRKGVPDFESCFHGQFIAVETKFGSNGLSAHQSRECKDLALAGAIVLVIDETNLDVLQWVLVTLNNNRPKVEWWHLLPQHQLGYLDAKK